MHACVNIMKARKVNKAKAWLVCCEKSQTVDSDSSDRETEEPERLRNKAEKQVAETKCPMVNEVGSKRQTDDIENEKKETLLVLYENALVTTRSQLETIRPGEVKEKVENQVDKSETNKGMNKIGKEDNVENEMENKAENNKLETKAVVENKRENEIEVDQTENKLETKADVENKRENEIGVDQTENKLETKTEGDIEKYKVENQVDKVENKEVSKTEVDVESEVENEMENKERKGKETEKAENKLEIKADSNKVEHKRENKIEDQVDKMENKGKSKTSEGDVDEIKNEVEIGSNVDNEVEKQHKQENILPTSHISKKFTFSFNLRNMLYEYSITITCSSMLKSTC